MADGWKLVTVDDPEARRLERRGRWWLVAAYVVCPCHLPVSMAVLGAALGGTSLGAAVVGDAWRLGIGLGVLYLALLAVAFRSLRRAKARVAAGERLRCGPDACEVVADARVGAT